MLRPQRWIVEQQIAGSRLENAVCEISDDRQATVTGIFKVHVADGPMFGPFTLRIVYPTNFPSRSSVPHVFLLQSPYQWENVLDSHIEDNWRLCLGVPVEMKIDFEHEDSLDRLFEVTGLFLFLQTQFQRELAIERKGGAKAVWSGPERPHGFPGMALAIKGWKLSRDGNRGCPCGSGVKLKDCHGPALRAKGIL